MRKRARKDRNHGEIVRAFEKMGCTVLDLAQLGGGCPDLLVGVHGRNVLVEVKDGAAPKSQRELTPDQRTFFDTWRGSKMIVENLSDAQTLVRALSH